MDRPNRETLINYFLGKCSGEENTAIDAYLAMKIDDAYVESCLAEAFVLQDEEMDGNDVRKERIWVELLAKQQENTAKPALQLRRIALRTIAAAAAIVFVVMTFAPQLFKNKAHTLATQGTETTADVLPGSDRALLTLADGKTISLSEVGEGQIAEQQGLLVEKTSDGEITYYIGDGKSSKASAYNTISTPRGGQFSVVLPDGSKARLNAASSLSYPIRFETAKRHVKMTGEVYFEVAKQKNANSKDNIPFVVETDRQTIHVLGTTFNVNAYSDEPAIRTTLVEGLVRVTVSSSGKSVLLLPGHEAWVDQDIAVKKADIKEQLAWVNGDFVFQKEELQSILRTVARWYDVEVDCPADLGRIKFSGMLSRQQPLTEIVATISSMNKVKLSLKGRRIIVEQ